MNPLTVLFLGALTPGQMAPLTLDQALALALQYRPAVRAAELRVVQARFSRRSLSAPPPTRLDLQATSHRELMGNDDDLALSQQIDLFGRRSANRSLGDAQVLLAEAGLRQTLGEVQGDVIDRYSEAVAASQLVQTAEAQHELTQRLLEATARRAEGGAIPPVQVKRANLEVQRSRQTFLLRQAAKAASWRRLAGVLGVSPSQVFVADFATLPITPAEPSRLRRQRADLLQIAAQSAIARANLGLSQVQFRPEFEISARASPYSYGPNQPAGLRATLSIPIFDNGRRKNDLNSGRAAVDAEEKSLADASALAEAELDAVKLELTAANEQREGFERLLADTRELMRVSDVGYREGATTFLEVLEAARALREVEESLVESRLRVAQVQAAYLRATGTLLQGAGH